VGMKKILLGLSVLCTLNAYALEDMDDYGIYVGGDFTVSFWDVDIENEATWLDSTPHESGSTTLENDVTDYSFEVRFGGYLRWGEDKDFLTALELFAAPHDVHPYNEGYIDFPEADTSAIVIQKPNVQYSFGAELKQGMFFYEDWLAFVKAGIIFTHYNIVTDLGVNPPHFVLVPHGTDKFNLTGGRFGAGVEKFWTEHISTTLQAFYIFYEEYNTSYSGTPDLGSSDNIITHDITFQPNDVQIGLGVNFYF
jgi:hypothetical protein